MLHSFEEMLNIAKKRAIDATNNAAKKTGQELARELSEKVKELDKNSPERKMLNKERIKALNLVLIQGGKDE